MTNEISKAKPETMAKQGRAKQKDKVNSKLSNAIFYCLLILLLWLPIPLGSNRPWAWSIMEIISFLLCIAVLISQPLASIKKQLAPYCPLIIGLGVFLIYQVIQFTPLPAELIKTLSPNTYNIKLQLAIDLGLVPAGGYLVNWQTITLDQTQSIIAFFKGLSYYLIMILTLVLVNNFQRLKWLIITIIIAGTWQAFYGSMMALSGAKYSWLMQLINYETANGSFVYKNHFANFLLICGAIGLGYLVATLEKNNIEKFNNKVHQLLTTLMSGKAALRIALAIMVIAIVLSRSRMGNSAFFISMTITGLLALWLMKTKSKSLIVLLISLFLIDTLILGAYFGINKVKNRIENTRINNEVRVEVNEYSLKLVSSFARTGTGGGSFYATFPMAQGNDVTSYFDHAHNDYLQFASEYGIPATFWLGFMVLLSLYYAITSMRDRRSKVMQGLGFGCTMAIIGMLLHISVDFQLQAPANAAYFHVILALTWIAKFGLRARTPKAKQELAKQEFANKLSD